VAVQGNVDPTMLFADKDAIAEAVKDCLRKAGGKGHVLNLGHGVLVGGPAALLRCCAAAALLLRCCCAAVKLRAHAPSTPCGAHEQGAGRAELLPLAQVGTPEESVAHMFDLSKQIKYKDLQ
jgi:hypothetical protein